ncbi:hypothetical protein BD779DRAFT_1469127 [Infundibulicybe gibba]|nr:hypothetical protein BD779DRAFT_1469127 [Infundibulicybe gibba]
MNPPTSTRLYVERHHPVITPRIEFKPATPRPLPSITSRIEFTAERLAYVGTAADEPSECVEDAGSNREADQTPPRITLPRSNKRAATGVPKPPGEPGRPGSGGYCVETVLVTNYQWTKDSVRELTEAVRAAARRELNLTKSFRSQNKAAIRAICDQMMQDDHWPLLKDYDDCWPVRSILKLNLKYRAEASRRATAKHANERLRAAMRGESPIVE